MKIPHAVTDLHSRRDGFAFRMQRCSGLNCGRIAHQMYALIDKCKPGQQKKAVHEGRPTGYYSGESCNPTDASMGLITLSEDDGKCTAHEYGESGHHLPEQQFTLHGGAVALQGALYPE